MKEAKEEGSNESDEDEANKKKCRLFEELKRGRDLSGEKKAMLTQVDNDKMKTQTEKIRVRSHYNISRKRRSSTEQGGRTKLEGKENGGNFKTPKSKPLVSRGGSGQPECLSEGGSKFIGEAANSDIGRSNGGQTLELFRHQGEGKELPQ